MLSIEQRHLRLVQDILNKYPYTFYAFGSRVKGNSKRGSDLDICFYEEIPLNVLSHLDEDFEESDLPFKVDIVNALTCNEDFRQLIQNDLVNLKTWPLSSNSL